MILIENVLALQFSLLLSQFSIRHNKTAHRPGTLIRTAAYEYNISCWTYCKEQSFQKKSLFVCMTNYLSPKLHWYSWAAECNMWHKSFASFLCVRYFHTDLSLPPTTAVVHHTLSAICSLQYMTDPLSHWLIFLLSETFQNGWLAFLEEFWETLHCLVIRWQFSFASTSTNPFYKL